MTDQPFKRPPAPDWARAGATFAPIGALTVIVGIAPLPGWAVVVALTWLLLCLVAWLGTLDAASRTHIARSLNEARFTQLYTFTAGRQLKLLWRRFCDDAPEYAGLLPTFRAALTWRLYDAALLLAVAYPFLLFVGWWLLGFEGRLGSAAILSAAPLWPERVMTGGVLAALVASLFAARSAVKRAKGAARWVFAVLPFVASAAVFAALLAGIFPSETAFALAATAALVGASASAFAGVVAIAIAIAVAGAGAVAFGGVVAGMGAGALGIATLAITAWLDRRGRQPLARAFVTAAVAAFWIVGALSLPWDQVPDAVRAVFLFLAVLPLLNALFDVVSYAVTLTLMRRGLRAALPLLYGLADLAAALVLFLALGAALTAAIAGLNRLAGAPILDLGVLFAGLHSDPQDYWWLYAMVFSTIVPTALHGALSLLGAQALAPPRLRRPAARLLEEADRAAWKAVAAPLAVGAVWALPFFIAAGILWFLWWIGADALAWLGGFYLHTLTDLAVWIGAF